mmetsp:Transcript_53466/g.153414  ORF Transcript_53466/g.153414 Transcript_53466/m.153414 type:complete len:368 (+) Transcript_53466:168-1271(+)
MGNSALEAFADITSDGNKWRNDIKLPSHSDVLSNSQLFPNACAPRLLVAAVASGVRGERIDAYDASAPWCSSPAGTEASRLGRQLSGELCRTRSTSLDMVGPLQVVLQPGTGVVNRPGLRPCSRSCWRPLSACPGLQKRGTLLTEARLVELRPNLPVASRFSSCWKLIYSPSVHGVSLRTFYRQCQSFPGETLLLVEDTNGVVFGCFASQTWCVAGRQLHCGSVECFVFSFGPPDQDEPLAVHSWAGGNQYFMFADLDGFSMGGGKGRALSVHGDLLTGVSSPSETFGTLRPLASEEEFVIRSLECWTFDHSAVAAGSAENPWTGLGPGSSPVGRDGGGSGEEGYSPMDGCAKRRQEAMDISRYRFG